MSADRFWSKVDRSGGPDACWIWLLRPNGAGGYGRFSHDGVRTMAHRYAYELEIGPVPEGLTLDHLCRNTMCVNPAHLEPVTLGENVLRSDCPPAQNGRKDKCKRGHPFDLFNTIRRTDGYRECRACARVHALASSLRRRTGLDVTVHMVDASVEEMSPGINLIPCPDGSDECLVAFRDSEVRRFVA